MEEVAAKNFENLYEAYKGFPVEKIYHEIMKGFKIFTRQEPPKDITKNYVERNYLEASIIMVRFVHCVTYGIDYETFDDNVEELGKLREKNKLLKYLLDLKFELYGKEIFEELGMEIVERVENGVIVTDKNNYS